MRAEDTVLSKAEIKEVLVKAGCPEDLINRIGSDIFLWWKAGWIQEILLAQKKVGEGKVVEWIEKHSVQLIPYREPATCVLTSEWQAFRKGLGR